MVLWVALRTGFRRCLWASLRQEEGVINGGKGNLLLALHPDSHTDQKQETAGNVSLQVERQGGQRASEAACYRKAKGIEWQGDVWTERLGSNIRAQLTPLPN